ncbi:DUF4087 domain-containing protein [Rhodobacter capsulatus]|uniref:DUF4087 domain-containing protein n=1 Tax=Rhodobacter capsulatus TaxID=1061 RepID=UPI004029E9F3
MCAGRRLRTAGRGGRCRSPVGNPLRLVRQSDPGNFYLVDADANWWFASQGSLEVGGWEELDWSEAEFGDEWVATNGYYGYGCACAAGDYGRAAEGEVLSIASLKALPLAKCEADPALPPPPRD